MTTKETQIREALDAGDLRRAAEIGLRAYGPEIASYLIRSTGSEDRGLEAFSQFCEDLWLGIGGFEGRSSFRTWAYRVASNAARRGYRDPFRRRGRRLETLEAERLAAELRDSTAAYMKTEVKDRFAALRRRLDPEDRQLLILRVDRRMAWQEIALVMEEGTAPLEGPALRRAAARWRKRFERLKDRLRRMFREEGLLD